MSIRTVSISACALALVASAACAGPARADLPAQAEVAEADARAIALHEVPDGTIASAELEKEHGKLVWSFDIGRPMTNNLTEVQVDARSGAIVSNRVETPAEQAREAAADAKPHR